MPIHPDSVALDALVWCLTHEQDESLRAQPVSAADAMREAIESLYAGRFTAWPRPRQTRAADVLTAYLACHLDDLKMQEAST